MRGLAGGLVLAWAVWSAPQHGARPIGPDEVAITAAPYEPVANFHSSANAVQVEVRVLDRSGKPAAGLEQSDFRIEDDGAAEPIASFVRVERASAPTARLPAGSPGAESARCPALAAPRSILLYFDDFAGTANDIAYARSKLLAYLDQAACQGRLPAGEAMGVVTSSGQGDLALTSDAAAIRRSLLPIMLHPRTGDGLFCPLITPYQAWEIIHIGPDADATRLAMLQALKCSACSTRDCYTVVRNRAEQIWGEADAQARSTLALLNNSVVALSKAPGKRTLVLTSAGFLTQEFVLQQLQQKVIDAALHAGVVINALDAKALEAPQAPNAQWDDPWLGDPQLDSWRLSSQAGGFSPVDSAMWEIAESTGGDFLHDSNDLKSGYQNDIEGPEVSYAMTFSRPDLKYDGAFHRLKVKVTRPGDWRVAARYGYFAPTADAAPLTSEQQQTLVREVLGSDRQAKLDAVLGAQAAPGGVHATIRLNPNALAFKKTDGRHLDRLTLVFALLSPDGKFITGERADVNLHLTDASLKEIARPGEGLPVGATLTAPPGTYRLRAVALEPSTGALMSISGKLEIAPGN